MPLFLHFLHQKVRNQVLMCLQFSELLLLFAMEERLRMEAKRRYLLASQGKDMCP